MASHEALKKAVSAVGDMPVGRVDRRLREWYAATKKHLNKKEKKWKKEGRFGKS
jgi:hypothetical protein